MGEGGTGKRVSEAAKVGRRHKGYDYSEVQACQEVVGLAMRPNAEVG